MTQPVAIAGPASPKALAGWLDDSDRDRALALPGLGGQALNNLVQALLEAGNSVELVTLAPELTERIGLEGRRLRILAAPYRQRARHHARDFFRSERRHVEGLVAATSAPVVNAHWTYEFALGALALPDRATIVSAHDAPFTILRYQRDLYRTIRTVMAVATRVRASVLTANSPYLAAAWRYQMLYRRPIRVIPDVVPAVAPAFNGARSGGTAPTILDVANEGPGKNVGALVRAMPHVLPSHPAAQLRLVGPGLTKDSEVARVAERLGVRQAVELLGPMDPDRAHDEYARATVFAHPSLEESFGMSVAEAMSHGLPVVGGVRAGAVPWLLDGGQAGLLVDARHPEAIADAVCRLLEDISLRAELGAEAAQRVRSSFSPTAVAATWMQLYEHVASARR